VNVGSAFNREASEGKLLVTDSIAKAIGRSLRIYSDRNFVMSTTAMFIMKCPPVHKIVVICLTPAPRFTELLKAALIGLIQPRSEILKLNMKFFEFSFCGD
jgi:hypothetical protein